MVGLSVPGPLYEHRGNQPPLCKSPGLLGWSKGVLSHFLDLLIPGAELLLGPLLPPFHGLVCGASCGPILPWIVSLEVDRQAVVDQVDLHLLLLPPLGLGILTKPQKIISRYTKLYETVSDFVKILHLLWNFTKKKFRNLSHAICYYRKFRKQEISHTNTKFRLKEFHMFRMKYRVSYDMKLLTKFESYSNSKKNGTYYV